MNVFIMISTYFDKLVTALKFVVDSNVLNFIIFGRVQKSDFKYLTLSSVK